MYNLFYDFIYSSLVNVPSIVDEAQKALATDLTVILTHTSLILLFVFFLFAIRFLFRLVRFY